MNWILFDDLHRNELLPLVYTRPMADIRIGILTIRQKWEHYLQTTTSTLTEHYLREKFPLIKSDDNFFINGSILPTTALVEEIKNLKRDEALIQGETLIAMRLTTEDIWQPTENSIETKSKITKIEHTWDIFAKNHQAIVD
ncbi:MAG: putative sugar nucleotidyl transferase, partial [Bacteroidales bacterium]|nr:putative sugar nucleotidyl transferase [Bacteroidales bacterium]